MNAEQVARLLGISAKTVHRHIAKGTIVATYLHAQELSIAEDQVEILRSVLSRDTSARSQDMSRQVMELTRRVTDLEERVRTLESRPRLLSSAQEPPKGASRRKPKKFPPAGCMTTTEFAHQHGVPWKELSHDIVIGYGKDGTSVEQWDRVEVTKEKRGDYLTPEQQTAALAFWQRHGVAFTMPES